MKKIAILLLLIVLISSQCLASQVYTFDNLVGEIDAQDDKYVKISWNINSDMKEAIASGEISNVLVEMDVKLDQNKYLSEREKPLHTVDASVNELRFSPFEDRAEMNANNTLVSIRLRYSYDKDGENIKTEFIDPIILGHDSYVKKSSYWSKNEMDTAIKMGLILSSFKDDVSRPITRYEFTKVLMKLNSYIGKKKADVNLTFDDVTDKDINLAHSFGLVNGVGGLEGNRFAGELNLTKQEMATILERFLNLLNASIDEQKQVDVVDMDQVASWAKKSVQTLLNTGIIKGDSMKKIDPMRNVTCEESIVMIIRIFNFVK